jgi:hypothetical protein
MKEWGLNIILLGTLPKLSSILMIMHPKREATLNAAQILVFV